MVRYPPRPSSPSSEICVVIHACVCLRSKRFVSSEIESTITDGMLPKEAKRHSRRE